MTIRETLARLVAKLSEQSSLSGLIGAVIALGVADQRAAAVGAIVVFFAGLAKVVLPEPGSPK